MTVYLSRLTLRRDPCTKALKALIDPEQRAKATDAHHRLLWSVFSDDPDRARDFLWRAEPHGRFYTLSARPPKPHGLFETPEVKAFTPVLAEGDRLAFVLRANAVTQQPKRADDLGKDGKPKRRKVDVAMNLLKDVPARTLATEPGSANMPSERQKRRYGLARQAAFDWLTRQGAVHGFALDPPASDDDDTGEPQSGFILDHYGTVSLPHHRGPRKGEPRFGLFDMRGTLTVTDPQAFLAKLAFKLDAPQQDPQRSGFGRAKAYGCGLMLIRRA